MKYLRVLAVAILTLLTFGAAQAQVTVRTQVGQRHHRHHHIRHHHHWHHQR